VARTGYTTLQDPTSGTIVADMRTFLGNLTTWTLGSLEVFQAATTSERNYYVLSHNTSTAEILIVHCPPGGTATTLGTSTLAAYQADYAVVGVPPFFRNHIGYAYSPGGGYLARFSAGDDPASDASFWPSDSSWVWPWVFYQQFRGPTDQVNVYMLEDDARAELIFYEGMDTQANRGYGLHIISDELITPFSGSTYQTNGVHYRNRSNEVGPQTEAFSAFTLYNGTSTPEQFNYFMRLGGMTSLTDSNQPSPDGRYLTRTLAVANSNEELQGTFNTSRECGRMTSTYGSLRGGGEYVHLWEDYFDPWATNLVTPPVT